ncbi:MAG: hypothetical protein K8F91_00960 [Candidatus Obscuribacterales bacterium]|nr:hypothetical protein [Candidatus Obscuribacterales bacterium]
MSQEKPDKDYLAAVLALAEDSLEKGQIEATEKLYILALAVADKLYGPLHPETGIVVNEFLFFCEQHDKPIRERQLQDRLKAILVSHYPAIVAPPIPRNYVSDR